MRSRLRASVAPSRYKPTYKITYHHVTPRFAVFPIIDCQILNLERAKSAKSRLCPSLTFDENQGSAYFDFHHKYRPKVMSIYVKVMLR